MDFLKLLWFLVRNTRVHRQGEHFHLQIRGLRLDLDAEGNVQVRADRDLRLNARFVLTQCDGDFDPEAYAQAGQSEQQAAAPCCLDPHEVALPDKRRFTELLVRH